MTSRFVIRRDLKFTLSGTMCREPPRLAVMLRELANFGQMVNSRPSTVRIKTEIDRVGITNGRLPAFAMSQPTLFRFSDSLECQLQ